MKIQVAKSECYRVLASQGTALTVAISSTAKPIADDVTRDIIGDVQEVVGLDALDWTGMLALMEMVVMSLPILRILMVSVHPKYTRVDGGLDSRARTLIGLQLQPRLRDPQTKHRPPIRRKTHQEQVSL